MIKSLILGAALALTSVTALAADAGSIAGVWQTKTGGYVQVFSNDNGTFSGEVVGSSDGKARYDNKNPDADKHGRRLLGVTLLNNLKYDGDKTWDGGTIYDPSSGKTYKAKATLTGPDTLDARGYIGISLLGKSQTWHRISPTAAHVHQDLLHKPIPPGPQ